MTHKHKVISSFFSISNPSYSGFLKSSVAIWLTNLPWNALVRTRLTLVPLFCLGTPCFVEEEAVESGIVYTNESVSKLPGVALN